MALIVTIAVMAFWLVVGVLLSYGWQVMTIYGVSLATYTTLYILFVRGVSFRILSGLYYWLGLSLIAVGWLPSGGVRGAIMHLFILIFISGLLVLTRKIYLAFVVSGVAVVVFFSYLEVTIPEIAAPYTNEYQHILDLVIANILMVVLVGTLLYYYKSEYLKDRKYIQGINADILAEKKRVEEANKSKSDFLATISHEMRTPLNGIIGITDLLAQTDTDQNQRELISHLEHSSVLLRSLISDVLDLTQIESNKLVLTADCFEPKKQLKELLILCKVQINQLKKPVVIGFEYDSDIPQELVGDIGRLRQILLNLINNATKFTSEGHIKVKVVLKEKKENIAWLTFSIKDTGVGITEEDQKKLFNKFYKANSNHLGEGSGLGLAISKSLTEAMGGSISIESALGKGTTFMVTLPFDIGKKTDGLTGEVGGNDFSFENFRVLLTEDVEVNRLVAIKMLNKLGIKKIDIAIDGLEAVELCKTKVYEIILMDLKMPGMSGLEATERIIKYYEESNQQKPYIAALTANAFKEDIDASREVGMDNFLSKPFNVQELEQLLISASEQLDFKNKFTSTSDNHADENV